MHTWGYSVLCWCHMSQKLWFHIFNIVLKTSFHDLRSNVWIPDLDSPNLTAWRKSPLHQGSTTPCMSETLRGGHFVTVWRWRWSNRRVLSFRADLIWRPPFSNVNNGMPCAYGPRCENHQPGWPHAVTQPLQNLLNAVWTKQTLSQYWKPRPLIV